MSIWAGIKYALNSTLGTEGFKPLDEITRDIVVENHDKPITQGIIANVSVSRSGTTTTNVTLTHPAIVTGTCEVRPASTSAYSGVYLAVCTQDATYSTTSTGGSTQSTIKTLSGDEIPYVTGGWLSSSGLSTSWRATNVIAWLLTPGTYRLETITNSGNTRATVEWAYFYLTGGVA